MTSHKRVYAQVDLSAFSYNLDEIKRCISTDTKILAVVKADGYGHGALALTDVMENRDDIWGYGAATVEEAIELIEAGRKKPVLILGYVFPDDFDSIVKYDIRTAVFSYETAKLLDDAAARQKKIARIHIKLDTGMGRIGFNITRENALETARINSLKHIEIEGVFTHFAKADETDKSFTRHQADEYFKFLGWLKELGVNAGIKHISNSAAIIDMPSLNQDLVRAGIILYGLWPSNEVMKDNIDIRPLLSLKSHVIHVKECFEGQPLSYGGTYRCEGRRIIATIPVGYGDGYPRSLSNRGSVLIRGKRAPICGRVCMDQFMVDVTDIPGAACGDTVTLIGRDGDDVITMEELSDISGRFNYEFACCLGKRIPRFYI